LDDVHRALDAFGDLIGEPLCLADHSAGRMEQIGVGALEFFLALLAFRACCAGNLKGSKFHAPTAIAQFGSCVAGDVGDLLHGPDQDPYTIARSE